MISRTTRLLAMAASGRQCAFPGCSAADEVAPGVPMLHLAHIAAGSPGGPRYDPSCSDVNGLENLIVLCPTHHALVDTQPQRFSAQKLKEYKDEHAYSVRERHGKGGTQTGRSKASKVERHTFALAVQMWQQSGGIGKEEYWHAFFKANPQILALALPNQVLLIGDKCYVGGKTWENIGGNIVDFLYANRQTKNVTLVEIKTPTTPLLGSEYRNGVFAPSDQLAGSIVQVFNYRSSLLKNFYSLSGADGRGGIEAHNPQCLVVVGNLETARLSAAQRSSFDLFRYGLAQCTVVTYDELFGKVQDVVDLLGE